MLYLDILKASAFNSPIGGYLIQNQTSTFSGSYALTFDGSAYSNSYSIDVYGSIRDGSGSIGGGGVSTYSIASGQFEFKIPIFLSTSNLKTDIVNTDYYAVSLSASTSLNASLSLSDVYSSTFSNLRIEDFEGNILFVKGESVNTGYTNYYRGSYINVLNQTSYKFYMPLYVCGEVALTSKTFSSSVGVDYMDTGTLNVSGSIPFDVFTLTSSAQESLKTQTNDTITHEELSELNNSMSEQVSTSKSILSKVTDFFGSFFTNFINSLKSLFIPENNYFSDWFSRVNDLLADKLGVLYYPFNLILSFLNDVSSKTSQSGQVVFPAIELPMNGEKLTILERQVINLSDYDISFSNSENSSLVGTGNYTSLVSTIRFFTSVVICMSLVVLFLRKLNHIVNGEVS